jgi:hypothetical protein
MNVLTGGWRLESLEELVETMNKIDDSMLSTDSDELSFPVPSTKDINIRAYRTPSRCRR